MLLVKSKISRALGFAWILVGASPVHRVVYLNLCIVGHTFAAVRSSTAHPSGDQYVTFLQGYDIRSKEAFE
jgi:hypothetical protein